MIIADFHTHSSNSGDCDIPMSVQIEAAINKGISHLCITEHMDYDFPETPDENISFVLDTDTYYKEFISNKEKYADKINLYFGVELGLQPHLANMHKDYISKYDFDFIIGSSHVCDGYDVYYPDFYKNKDEKACYMRYFESELENINAFNDFDVYGHLDYVVRYGPTKDANYQFNDYKDILDEILKKLISSGKGIEINTGGLKKGMKETNPSLDILKRYKELGGEIITVGSDAHFAENIAYGFDRAKGVLEKAGFTRYAVFKDRKPEFINL